MQRRAFLVSVGALAAGGCVSEPKLLQVTAPPSAPPQAKVERVLVWLSSNTGLVNDKLGDAFASALAPYGVPVLVG